MTAWYAVQCKPQMELWARSNLWERGLEAYLPIYLKLRSHARKREMVMRPLFPGYLFVKADLEAGQRPKVNTAPGVIRMVAFGDHTPRVPEDIIATLKQCEEKDGCIRLEAWQGKFYKGEQLVFRGEALGQLVPIFECEKANERAVLLLNILGRQVRTIAPKSLVSREV